MPAKKYIVDLDPAERETLLALTRKGEISARTMMRALILMRDSLIRRSLLRWAPRARLLSESGSGSWRGGWTRH